MVLGSVAHPHQMGGRKLRVEDFVPVLSYSSPLLSISALVVLLLPVVGWWSASKGSSGLVFVVTTFLSLQYVLQSHSRQRLSNRRLLQTSAWGQTHIKKKVVIKFPVPLAKLERFCAENHVSVVHVAVKAVAMGLRAFPQLNGHSILGNYVPCSTVDVSCEVVIKDDINRTALIKVCSADTLSVTEVSKSVSSKVGAIRDGTDIFCSRREWILRYTPPLIADLLDELFTFLGAGLGVGLPIFGIKPFPQGACMILNPCKAEVRPPGSEFVVEHEDDGRRDYLSPMLLTLGPIFVRAKLEGRVPTLPAYLPVALSVRLPHGASSHGASSMAEEEAVCKLANRIRAYLADPAAGGGQQQVGGGQKRGGGVMEAPAAAYH